MRNGKPTVCVPDPIAKRCVRPYHTSEQLQEGGPHGQRHSELDVDGGKMDGFVRTAIDSPLYCADHRSDPKCAGYLGPQGQPDVMSYHTAKEIPNYWRYAKEFVLQDHMFAPADSWTLPAHLFLVSAWAAHCKDPRDPMSCASDLYLNDEFLTMRAHRDVPLWAWTDITYLLHEHGVSWGYYVGDDTCFFGPCPGHPRENTVAQQNPLPWFTTIRETGQMDRIQTHTQFFQQAASGNCRRSRGSCRTTGWGAPGLGRADLEGAATRHQRRERADARPGLERDRDLPNVGRLGWFLRSRRATAGRSQRLRHPRPRAADQPVGLAGMIDSQTLSFDAYLKLIEDLFLDKERLNLATLSRPDSRPTVRERAAILGNLLQEFDFAQDPIPPLILDPRP